MWMSDPRLSIVDAYKQRWSTDLHPPLYYFVVWCVRHLINYDYTSARLANFYPVILVIPLVALWKKYRGIDPWIATFTTILLSSPYFIAYFAELRSYYSLTVLGACLILVSRVIRDQKNDASFADIWLIITCIAIILLSLNLHYSASMVYFFIIFPEIIINLKLRKPKWAVILGLTTFISGLLLTASLIYTLKTVPYFSFLHTPTKLSLEVILGGVAFGTIVNIGVDISLLYFLLQRGVADRSPALLSFATLAMAALALFAQSLVTHAMSLKYVLDLLPLGAAFVADVAANQLFLNGAIVVLMAVSTLINQGVTTYHELNNKRWLTFVPALRELGEKCPATQFVGIDQNALPEFARHPQVSGWIGVFPLAYRTIGDLSGVRFAITQTSVPINVILKECPLVVLSEHEVSYRQSDTAALIRNANIFIDHYKSVKVYEGGYDRLLVFYP